MRKMLLTGAAALIMTSGVALADDHSSSTTTHTGPLATSSTTRVDKSATDADGTSTSKTKVTHSSSMPMAPAASSETTVKKTTIND